MNRHKKRKVSTPTALYGTGRGKGKLDLDDGIISSEDDNELNNNPSSYDESGSDSEDDSSSAADDDNGKRRTVEEVKLKLAKDYLSRVGAQVEEEDDDDDDEDDDEDGGGMDKVGYRLQHERRANEGTLERELADEIGPLIDSAEIRQLRGHDLTPTCVALHKAGNIAYSGSKDNSVLQWDVEHEKRTSIILPLWKKSEAYHTSSCSSGEVLSIDASDDGRYLAVGGRDNLVRIFDVRSSNASNAAPVTEFKGHKSAVTCVKFRTNSLQLFSGSEDRCIRHYSLDEMAYVETLYGHQAAVMSIDCYRQERPISIGRDRTMRSWKLAEDSHLIYRGGSLVQPPDSLAVVKDNWFVTGHEDGLLSLWSTEKKKPAHLVQEAHGAGNGIASCNLVKGSDLLATGSKDGFVRFWKVSTGRLFSDRSIDPIGKVPLQGFVNDIAIASDGRFCVAAVGQEHRLGRWDRVSKSKNRFTIIRFNSNNNHDETEDDQEEHELVESNPYNAYPSSGNNADDDYSSSGDDTSTNGHN